MKKLIALVLTAVMCLSITSCGASEKEELYDKYEKIIEALEDKDYEDAVGEIYKIYQENEESDDDKWGVGDDGEDEDEVDPEVEVLKAAIPGEWIPSTYTAEEYGFENITFNEDGTVVIGEDNLTWEISDASSNYASIYLKNGETTVYSINLSKYDDGSYRIGLSEYVDENTSNYCGEFYRVADYTMIEVTAENWDDYFEVIETSEVYKNDFGEAEHISVSFDMVLKEEYGKVNSSISKTVVEFSYKEIVVKYSADLETGSYTMGGVVDDRAEYDPYTSTYTLGTMYYDDDIERYGMDYDYFTIDEFPEDEVWINKDFSVTRVLSTIYVYNIAE